ncbi:MAG: hypothetical protein ABSF22_04035 [Bryobacteraceae bacterium]|jgi:hypothetical protein
MSDEQKLTWDPDEFRKVTAAHHAEFDEKYKQLMARLEKPLPDWEQSTPQPLIWERSAASKEADARLKALQEYLRNLPRRDSAAN